MTGFNLCGTSDCTADVYYNPSSAGGVCGSRDSVLRDAEQPLARSCLQSAVAAERKCLLPQPHVCTATCTDVVLNTAYNGNGNSCGSCIAYWLRREPEAVACARVANEQSHVCRCYHPDPTMRPNNC